MKQVMIGASFAVALTTAPAMADQGTFLQGVDVCFENGRTFPGARQVFQSLGWQESIGMSDEEFEFFNGDTSVFLALFAPIDQPGCTIMDESIDIEFARAVLLTMLGKHFPNNAKGIGYNNSEVWRGLVDLGTLNFSVGESPSGSGAAISVELRP